MFMLLLTVVLIKVAPREGRVSRNVKQAAHDMIDIAVAPREGRVSRNIHESVDI